jgi:GYF domain 2
MFKILGADGREYGPVAIDQIKKWIAEGRANRETMAKQANDVSWKPLGQFAEFADVLGVAAPAETGTPPPAGSPAMVAAAAVPSATPIASTPGDAAARARAQAQQLVNGPAIALMVTAGLGLALGLLGLVQVLSGMGSTPDLPGLDPEVARLLRMFTHGPVAIASNLIGMTVSVLIFLGALRMQKLTSHGLALAAAIIAMIPCFSPCCFLGLPFGIWALVVLAKPEVKSQFH